MTRFDEIRAAHARHRATRTVECDECVLLDEIDRQHAALISRRSWCLCGDEIRVGTLNAEGCLLTADGWECGTCVSAEIAPKTRAR